jgi:hypothetical protein
LAQLGANIKRVSVEADEDE